jgi:hypothetical protein
MMPKLSIDVRIGGLVFQGGLHVAGGNEEFTQLRVGTGDREVRTRVPDFDLG